MNNSEEKSLLTRIAWMYYVQGLTQGEIAKKINFSRIKVTRCLAKAKEMRIVEINIATEYRACLEIEDALKQKFSLLDVIVVPSGNSLAESREGAGRACASYLENILTNGDIVGIAWGTSLYEVGKFLNLKKPLDITVVQLMGGLNSSEKINPEEIVKQIALRLNATGVWLNTPAIMDTPEIKKALLSDEGVKKVLAKAGSCSKAIFGLGDVSDEASLVVSNVLSVEDMYKLRSLGAIGNLLGWFFDINGQAIYSDISERVISVPLEDIKRIPLRICVASGKNKATSILGAMRGGCMNVLVTDELTAQEVLRLVN
jgi:deoxyribonucleoside regulator